MSEDPHRQNPNPMAASFPICADGRTPASVDRLRKSGTEAGNVSATSLLGQLEEFEASHELRLVHEFIRLVGLSIEPGPQTMVGRPAR